MLASHPPIFTGMNSGDILINRLCILTYLAVNTISQVTLFLSQTSKSLKTILHAFFSTQIRPIEQFQSRDTPIPIFYNELVSLLQNNNRFDGETIFGDIFRYSEKGRPKGNHFSETGTLVRRIAQTRIMFIEQKRIKRNIFFVPETSSHSTSAPMSGNNGTLSYAGAYRYTSHKNNYWIQKTERLRTE
ncbi:hypothetical protein A3218_02715 [Pseudomonas chlororaphis]|nr:hypothetical protein A3218_02715 [Pseudomonas chlororaphis]